MEATVEAPSAQTCKDYTSPPGALSRFFRMSQDGWKSKYKDLKATVKGHKDRIARLARSREQCRSEPRERACDWANPGAHREDAADALRLQAGDAADRDVESDGSSETGQVGGLAGVATVDSSGVGTANGASCVRNGEHQADGRVPEALAVVSRRATPRKSHFRAICGDVAGFALEKSRDSVILHSKSRPTLV